MSPVIYASCMEIVVLVHSERERESGGWMHLGTLKLPPRPTPPPHSTNPRSLNLHPCPPAPSEVIIWVIILGFFRCCSPNHTATSPTPPALHIHEAPLIVQAPLLVFPSLFKLERKDRRGRGAEEKRKGTDHGYRLSY